MKNKILISIFLSTFLLIASSVKAVNFTDNQTVGSNKTWTIKFTDEVGFDDVTKKGISVKDAASTITRVDDISVTVNQNDSYTLLSTVKDIMSDGSMKDVNIKLKN